MGDSDFSRNSSTDSGIDEFYESTERIVSSCLEMGPAVTPTSMQQTRLTISERSVVFLVKKHLEENPEVFDIMCEELSLSSTDFYSRLQEVWGGIFTDDRINWGRILTMLCFCRAVSAYSRKIDIPPSAVESIVPWATCFISQTLKDWIVAEGGWDAFPRSQLNTNNIRTHSGAVTKPQKQPQTGANSWVENGFKGLAFSLQLLDALSVR